MYITLQVTEQVGNVIEEMPDGDVHVFFEDICKVFVFNPASLKPAGDMTSHKRSSMEEVKTVGKT